MVTPLEKCHLELHTHNFKAVSNVRRISIPIWKLPISILGKLSSGHQRSTSWYWTTHWVHRRRQMGVWRSGSKCGDVILVSLVLAAFLGQSLETFLLGSVCKSNADRQSLFTNRFPVVLLNDRLADLRRGESKAVRRHPNYYSTTLPSKSNTTAKAIEVTKNFGGKTVVVSKDSHEHLETISACNQQLGAAFANMLVEIVFSGKI